MPSPPHLDLGRGSQPRCNRVWLLPRADGIAAEVTEIYSKFANPVIVIAGDFNHANVGDALKDVGDFKEIVMGPT